MGKQADLKARAAQIDGQGQGRQTGLGPPLPTSCPSMAGAGAAWGRRALRRLFPASVSSLCPEQGAEGNGREVL